MPWPTHTLTSEGFGEYTSPIENIRGKTPHPTWDEHHMGAAGEVGNWKYWTQGTWGGEDSDWAVKTPDQASITYWNMKENPIWESAANALNIDWNVFTNTYQDQGSYEAHKNQAVEWWMNQEANYRPAYTTTTGGGGPNAAEPTTVHHDEYIAPHKVLFGLDSREGPVSAMRIGEIERMNDWITGNIKHYYSVYPDSEILEEGPTSEQYGLPKGTDPWSFYGLDKLPRLIPKSLDVDYEFNLNPTFGSQATYMTPKGYPEIDLDSVQPAGLGASFTEYIDKMEFAQDFGYWDEDLGTTGGPEYQAELEFIFGDAAKDVRIFGQADYDNLANQGLGKDEIEQAILRRTELGQKLIFGPKMAKLFDRYAYDPRWWGEPADTVGEKGVRLLRLQGLDDAGIMNRYAKGSHGSKIGQWVQENFGIRLDAAGMYDYYFQDPGDKNAFGMQDYNQLLDQGMDPTRVSQIATEFIQAGGIIGGAAAEAMGIGGFQAATEVLAGQGHLGGRVIDEYRAIGWDDAKLQSLGMDASTITIGKEAATELWGWHDRGDLDAFGMKDINENWPVAAPDKVILGKIAAGVSTKIGQNAVDHIWGDEVYELYMTPPNGADRSAYTFGMDTINYLTNHPTNPVLSKKGLIAIANGAPFIGEQAANTLGIPARKAEISLTTLEDILTTPIASYDKPTLGGEYGGFGQQEITWMESSGWTEDQMRAITKDFEKIGPVAAKQLWGEQLIARMPAPANAVNPNALTFGLETIKYLDAVDPQIHDKSIAAIARGTATYVGAGARKWFADNGIDIGMGQAPTHSTAETPTTTWPSQTPSWDTPPSPEPPPLPEVEDRPRWVDQGTQGGFGSKDMNWLKDHGYSQDEMKDIAASLDKIGPDAARDLWGYTDPGDRDWFGAKDYDQLKRHGASDDIMRKIIRGMGLQLGDKYKWLR